MKDESDNDKRKHSVVANIRQSPVAAAQLGMQKKGVAPVVIKPVKFE